MTKRSPSVRIVTMAKISEILDLVTTPGRYLPLEQGAVIKEANDVRLRMALAFPDLYEVGMSHLGVRILYHLMNEKDWIYCERAYAPWTDMEEMLREKEIPLFSLETQTPLSEFDMVGFSLTYEMSYTNVLNMMELSGIPLLSSEREGTEWPLIIGGGPCASNPEPVAEFFDAILFGDGEEAILDICRAVADAKDRGADKGALLKSLAEIEGVYVPALFEPEYDSSNRFSGMKALFPGHEKVTRRIVADLEDAYFPEESLVPLIEPVHDRVMIEIARGCSRGCRFCHAGIINRPVRERSESKAAELARRSLAKSGYEECSLLSLSAGDYSAISELLTSLIREHYMDRVSVSLPSLRVQALSDEMLEAIESVRKTGFTIAPEAGTDRLRAVINKDYAEEELMETARRVFSHGWRNLKLYFMVGLPTETEEDLDGIVSLAKRISGIKGEKGKPKVTVNITGFVPKPHTPFQWEAQADLDYLEDAYQYIKKGVSGKNRKLKWQDPRMTRLEGVFSRGDRRLSGVLLEARKKGLRFDGWSEHFDYDAWMEAFRDAGVDPGAYTGARDTGAPLPWDHLDAGVDKDWLLAERDKALRAETSADCRTDGCVEPCGVCDHSRVMPIIGSTEKESEPARISRMDKAQPEIFFRYRVKYARRGPMRFMGQLEVTRLFTRAVRRAGLPMRYSQGYHPQPRIMFGPTPPVGVESESEYIDVELIRRVAEEEIASALDDVTPRGIAILEVSESSMRAPAITAVITGHDYVVETGEGWEPDPAVADDFMDRESFVFVRKRLKGDKEIDARQIVRELRVDDGNIYMSLKAGEGPGIKPHEVLEHVFGMDRERIAASSIKRVDTRLKKSGPARYSGKGQRVRRTRGGRWGSR